MRCVHACMHAPEAMYVCNLPQNSQFNPEKKFNKTYAQRIFFVM